MNCALKLVNEIIQRSNPGLPSGRAAINHVSHGTTSRLFLFITETEIVYGAVRTGSLNAPG